jgi:dTDP-4-dehydrorhamnose reductase
MKIAVIGAKGMLGVDFCNFLIKKGTDLIQWDIPEMDITNVDKTIARVPGHWRWRQKKSKPNFYI